jgi:hypothetical protein
LSKSFSRQFSSWTNNISPDADWTIQLRVLNDIVDLITPKQSLKEIIALIYLNVNQLLDAYQFCVAIYDEKEGLIHYKGMIENGKPLPDFSIDALDNSRLASGRWNWPGCPRRHLFREMEEVKNGDGIVKANCPLNQKMHY